MLGQDTTDVLAFACVNVEVYATLRFIERNAYKSFGIDYSFITLVFAFCKYTSFFYQNGIYSCF